MRSDDIRSGEAERSRKDKNLADLIDAARSVLDRSYSPYSKFRVAAAVLTNRGNIYTGVNVENASYGLTICAERTALVKAISEGEREFEALVVVADTERPISPCGACRQFMAEFGDFKVVLANVKGEHLETSVGQLLPLAFTGENLRETGDDPRRQ